MMDAVTYETVQCKNAGWMSEAHRLSLGANRPGKRPDVPSNASRFSHIALATFLHVEIAWESIMQPVARWFSTLKTGSGVHHSTM
jgi:hypothetical protein